MFIAPFPSICSLGAVTGAALPALCPLVFRDIRSICAWTCWLAPPRALQ